MTLISLILALLLEQLRPLPVQGVTLRMVRGLASSLARRINDGSQASGRIAWLMMMAASTLAVAGGYWLLWEMQPILAFLFNVLVLYLCMGFRHDSHFFSAIHVALRLGEHEQACALLGGWRGTLHNQASPSEVARLAIEQGLVASHRSLFGVVFWFVLLPGPSGAVMYRVARELAQQWGSRRDPDAAAFGRFAQRAWEAIEWLPVRVTASVFSIMGNFEDAIYCWRSQAVLWPEKSSAILIASGGGALGVRLGMPVHEAGTIVDRPEMGLGSEAGVEHMQSTVGLLWRALFVCLFLLALLAIAGWVGR
jgi:adenosylcobinamide-phosphate synthase